jgi:hypothetical protein
MQTAEIPRATWSRTLNEFSKAHQGEPISVDILDAEIGAQPEVQGLPLLGITAEPREGHDAIIIAAEKKSHESITHIVDHPSRVWIERSDGGTDLALQIESPGGKTIVRVGASAG